MDTRIGKQLTQAREALGLIVEDVAHRTKIPASIVRQLESEDYSHFPNNVYAKSFLRLYSRHLGIDPTNYIAAHEGRLQSREDEVTYLDGIAVSTEFQNIEEKQATAAAAAAAVAATGSQTAPGKISSGFMTVLLLVVVGIPTAFLLRKMYNQEEPPPTATTPPPTPAVQVTTDPPVAEPEPGGSPDAPPSDQGPAPKAEPVSAPSAELASNPVANPGSADTLNPSLAPTAPEPASTETGDDFPHAIRVEEPGGTLPSNPIVTTPVSG